MSRALQYALFCCLLAITLASSTPTRTGYPRSNRGFKSQGLSTARGFGKRGDSGLSLGHGVFMGQGGGGGSPPLLGQQVSVESLLPQNVDSRGSYPNSWLIEELQNNPEAAKIIVEKIIDDNGDGELTPDELYRRNYF